MPLAVQCERYTAFFPHQALRAGEQASPAGAGEECKSPGCHPRGKVTVMHPKVLQESRSQSGQHRSCLACTDWPGHRTPQDGGRDASLPRQPPAANEDNFPKRSIQWHSHFPFRLFQIETSTLMPNAGEIYSKLQAGLRA